MLDNDLEMTWVVLESQVVADWEGQQEEEPRAGGGRRVLHPPERPE